MNDYSNMSPVFLLGAGRSGTKFLRDILGTSTQVSTIPYDVGYVWRYGNESCPHDQFTSDMLNDSIKQYVRKTLPKLSQNKEQNSDSRILLEKTVSNPLRVEFVHSIYPEGKFIHLIRDGRAVTESAMRMWKSPPNKHYLLKKLRYFPWKNYRYAIYYTSNMLKGKLLGRGQLTWGGLYKGIVEDAKTLPLEIVCARQWKRTIELAQLQLSKISQDNILEVRYENLIQDKSVLIDICDYLELEDRDKIMKVYEQIINRSHTEKWKSCLDTSQLELINDEIGFLNCSLGYRE